MRRGKIGEETQQKTNNFWCRLRLHAAWNFGIDHLKEGGPQEWTGNAYNCIVGNYGQYPVVSMKSTTTSRWVQTPFVFYTPFQMDASLTV